jgi:hypothetical protein
MTLAGPAARLRRKEQENLAFEALIRAASDRPVQRWKIIAFSCAIFLGIIMLWPVLVVSAARTERTPPRLVAEPPLFGQAGPATKFDQDNVEAISKFFKRKPPTDEVERCVAEVKSRYIATIPWETYEEYRNKMRFDDQLHFDDRLDSMDFAIIGSAISPNGDNVVFKVRAFHQIGRDQSLLFSKSAHTPTDAQPYFRTPMRPEDEIWSYGSSSDHWKHLAGRAGLVLVREKRVIDTALLIIN